MFVFRSNRQFAPDVVDACRKKGIINDEVAKMFRDGYTASQVMERSRITEGTIELMEEVEYWVIRGEA